MRFGCCVPPDKIDILARAGYDRRISAECSWEDLEAQAAGALAFMRSQWYEKRRAGERA